MQSGKYNTTIEQGAVFRRVLTWKDDDGNAINLTGYSAVMQIRETKESETVIHELTSEDGGITITPATGKLALFISAADTEDFDFGSAYYDLELDPGDGEKIRLIEGIVSLSKEVTRDDES